MVSDEVVVSICCITYNQAPYIRQCLEGFMMQQTDFPIEVLIHDDASTDGTTEIIKEYEAKYPDIIKPIYEEENQWVKGRRGSAVFNFPRAKGKYIAMCEGDDYWTDSLKLQKQVDFLEANPEYSMACSDATILTSEGELDWCRYIVDTDVPIDDIIVNGGLFIQTASYFYRRVIMDKYPNCCINCHVGDYPLIIYAALNGKVRWFAEKQVAYRFSMGNSWTATNARAIIKHRIRGWRSEMNMLAGLDLQSNLLYHTVFNKRQAVYLYTLLRDNQDYLNEILLNFQDVIPKWSFKQRLGIFLMRLKLYNLTANLVYRIRKVYE